MIYSNTEVTDGVVDENILYSHLHLNLDSVYDRYTTPSHMEYIQINYKHHIKMEEMKKQKHIAV